MSANRIEETARAPGSQAKLTLARALFWAQLRRRMGRLHFCRNYPTGDYVHDFYCLGARLAVTISDGPVDPVAADQRRRWLVQANVALISLDATEVCADVQGSVEAVVQAALSRLPTDDPAAIA